MRLSALVFVLLVLLPAPAEALCIGFDVSATALSFGLYNPGAAAATTSQGTVKVQCTIGLLGGFSVALSKGAGTFARRTMTMGSSALNYNIYTDGGHAMVWGDGTGGTLVETFSALISLGSTSFTAYGQIAPGQYRAPGHYSDTNTATVTF